MAMATIVAFYRDFRIAQRVMDELAGEGIDRDGVSIVGHEAADRHGVATVADVPPDRPGRAHVNLSGIGPVVAIGPIERDLANNTIEQALRTRGIPAPDVERAAEGLRRGGSLVIVEVPEADHDRALAVIDRHDPGGIDAMQETYPEPGWSRSDEVTGPRGVLEVADDWLNVKRPEEGSQAFRPLAPTSDELTDEVRQGPPDSPAERPDSDKRKGGTTSRAGPDR